MVKSPKKIFGTIVVMILFFYGTISPCSSWMLKKNGRVIAGHNLDKTKHAHGVLVVNKRGVWKKGKSWTELAYNKAVSNPSLSWISKYGSVTFNRFCRDFPDGGMNEKGLFISEMSLADTQYPTEDLSKPKLFMCLWMQYVLDNFHSVDQIVKSLNKINIEGWSWHFFAADQDGNAAVIEFLDKKTVIYTGDNLPITALTNLTYAREMELIKKYKDFGGEKEMDLSNDQMPIFNYPAKMIKDYTSQKPLIDYGFEILKKSSWWGTQWSWVCDLKELKIYFKTKVSQKIKTIDMQKLDFSCATPVKMLDVHAFFEGPVEQYLHDYNPEYNKACVYTTFKISNYESVFTDHGSTLKAAVKNFGTYSETTRCKN